MHCLTCGTLIAAGLNYCNRCGAKIDKLVTTDDPTGIQHLSMATGFVGLGGLGILVGLVAVLLKNAVEPKIVMMIAIFYLAALFGISYLLIQQLSRLISNTGGRKMENKTAKSYPEFPAQVTAQLDEHREPAASVTENTTKTLDDVLLKRN